ncbi:protein RETARDED ROOT GROWTH, mitochondrial isoform X2 [Telopea speciosissima]|uniref:protein RETARDED ROOT GROWTH, mitochondrial isoform X2 n=1 Tax=Telopea speciosissima TaxID=54955 RepID=UPI001CC5F906|nr:protein RETARDED ROOT GROWTH, mitochondrial isoform X2 [Telopea speciosissima]
MGRWRASFLLKHLITSSQTILHSPCTLLRTPPLLPVSRTGIQSFGSRFRSAIPYPSAVYDDEFPSGNVDFGHKYEVEPKEEEEVGKILVKAYFLCTSIDLKRIQTENSSNVVPPSSRSSNYIALRYCNFPSEVNGAGIVDNGSRCCYMVVFQYGSVVLFNIADDEVESYLEIVKRHAFGLIPEMRRDDYAVKEKPLLVEDMQGGPDYIVLKYLDIDGIRIIGSVLGQSVALDYFVSQIDDMVEEFTDINRGLEKNGTFTMDRRKLFQLVGKANSNIADVILKVGLFERSEIAWRDAKYAQILDYLREEYEVAQRFGNLNFKLKFVEDYKTSATMVRDDFL